MSGLDLYESNTAERMSRLQPTDTVEPAIFEGFLRGTGMEAMRQLARAGRSAAMAGAALPIILDPLLAKDNYSGVTLTDRYFKGMDEIFEPAIKAWTPEPNEVGVAGQVTGTLLTMLPMVMAGGPGQALALASMQMGTAQDLVQQHGETVPADKAVAAGAVMSAGLGLGIKVPIFGKSLWQRVLLGGAGFNVFQGAAMRGAAGTILEGTPAAEQFKAFDPLELTIDLLLGAGFGGIAHLTPAARAEGEQAWKALEAWGRNLKPSDVDALAVMRQAQHINVDTLPGKPTTPEALNAHVEKVKTAVEQTLRGEPVNVDNVGVAPPDEMVTMYHATTKAEAEAIRRDGLKPGSFVAEDEGTAWMLREQTLKPAEEIVAVKVPRSALQADELAQSEGTAGSYKFQPSTEKPADFEPVPERFVEAYENGLNLMKEAERIRAEEGLPPPPDPTPPGPSKVYTAVKEAFQKVVGDRLGTEYPDDFAKTIDAFYQAMARRTGRTVDQLMKMRPVEITGDRPGVRAMMAQQPFDIGEVNIRLNTAHPQVYTGLTMTENGGLSLDSIEVREGNEMQKGLGTKAMLDVTKVADEHGKGIILMASPKAGSGLSLEKLVEWYRRFGFEPLHEQEYSNATIMYRDANEKAQASTQDGQRTPGSSLQGADQAAARAGEEAARQVNTPEFNAWFGDSKVVDAEGKPLVVYHGTEENFNEFILGEPGNRRLDSDLGFFFTRSPSEAGYFTERADGFMSRAKGQYRRGANIMPVYLAIKNPKVYPTQKEMFADVAEYGDGEALYRALSKEGFDGVLVEDSQMDGAREQGSRWYVAFENTQIKSAVGNRGTFDPANPNILYQEGPRWYSELTRQVENLKQETAPAAQWKGMLNNLKGVKAEEIEWTGLNEWLDMQIVDKEAIARGLAVYESAKVVEGPAAREFSVVDKNGKDIVGAGFNSRAEAQSHLDKVTSDIKKVASGKITRQQIVDYLNSNGVKVDEVMKGDRPDEPFDLVWEEQTEDMISARLPNGGEITITEMNDGTTQMVVLNEDGVDTTPPQDFPTRQDAEAAAMRYLEEQNQLGPAKFGSASLQLPGAKPGSYRELLLTLPSKAKSYKLPEFRGNKGTFPEAYFTTEAEAIAEGQRRGGQQPTRIIDGREQFTRSHWDEANVLAHVRFNERSATAESLQANYPELAARLKAEGRDARVLGVEEFQNDLAQKIRKMALQKAEAEGLKKDSPEFVARVTELTKKGFPEEGLPSLPFSGKTEAWTALVIKRMIRYAAENDFDMIMWTRGEQQVERYTNALRQVVDRIEWEKTPEGVHIIGSKGRFTGPVIDDAVRDRGMEALQRNDLLGFDTAGDALQALVQHRNDWENRWDVPDEPDRIAIQSLIDGTTQLGRSSQNKVVDTRYGENELSDAIGKTLAEQIKNDPSQKGVIEGNNIRVDDTGMAGFYDRIVPNIANDILKKLGGGKVGEIKLGKGETQKMSAAELKDIAEGLIQGRLDVDEVNAEYGLNIDPDDIPGNDTANITRLVNAFAKEIRETTVPQKSSVQPGFEITPALKAKAMEGLPLFQKGGDQPRGYFEYGDQKPYRIGLTEDANKSTPLHEASHFFLQMTKDLAAEPDASPVLKDLVSQAFKWLGITEAEYDKLTFEEQRPYHERWARAGEAYFREGRAPTPELKGAFERFKDWLMEVYKTLTQLGVKIDDDFREIMDTMLGKEPALKIPEAKVETKSPLLKAIKELGGMDKQAMEDITGEKRFGKGVKGIPWGLFKEGGLGIDDLASQLRDMGWPIPEDDVDGGVQTLKDLVKSELEGDRTLRAGEDPQGKPMEEADAEQIMARAAEQEEQAAERYDFQNTPEYQAEIARIRSERDWALSKALAGEGDFIGAEARRVTAENPDMAIEVGVKEDGTADTMTAREYLDQANAEYEQAVRDADLYREAGDCLLGVD